MALTKAELRILASYARTGDQRAAARICRVTYLTAKNQLSQTYAKLGVNSAISAFRILGWLDVPGEL